MSTSTSLLAIRRIYGMEIKWPETLPVNCGLEEPYGTFFSGKTEEYTALLESLRTVKDNFESLCPPDALFWKRRLIVQVLLSPHITSISFIPYSLSSSTALFFQKIDQIEKTVGFVAPYLPEEEREIWEAESEFSICCRVSDKASAEKTIKWLEGSLHDEIKTCLRYFLKDKTSSAMGLTFMGPDQTYISCGWIKQ